MNRGMIAPLLLLLSLTAAAQSSGDEPLVTVGPITITKKEFIRRYELTPAINRRAGDGEADKAEFLLSMIAEKLLVLKAQQEGWNNDTVVNNAVREIEQLLVRDELYRKEVQEKITISEEERRLGMKRSLNDMKVYFLFAKTKEGAEFLSAQIEKGKPLESFSFSGEPDSEFAGPDSAIARWGDVDERMEHVIYNLKLNGTSKPVQLDDGWYIVKLMGKTVTVLVGERERNGQLEKVESVFRKRKEQKRMTEYMNAELKGIRTDVQARLMKSVIFHVWDIAQQRFPVRNDTTLFFIDHGVVDELRSRMKDSMQFPFVTFPHTVWTLAQTMEKIRTTNLATVNPTLRRIRADLEQRLKDIIDQEYLVQTGYRKGLHQSAAVQNDLKVWRDTYTAQIVKNRIEDTVTVTQKEIEELKRTFYNDTLIVNNDAAAREKMKQLKLNDAFDRYIGAAATNAEITFYEKNFTGTKVSTTTAMVYRYLGFGGRMFAVPFVPPQIGWIKYWDNKNVKLP
jgi:23S rRNA pseudoU1915 N3-methylase RlmH